MTGKDTHGNKWPCHFEAFGIGQSVLYSYLCMPLIAVFDLNVFTERLSNLIFAILALFCFVFLVGKLAGYEVGAISGFLLGIAPWHIMSARWGHEAYLFANLFVIAACFLKLGLERPGFLIAAAVISALCMYSYSSAHAFIPVFLTSFVICNWATLIKKKRSLVVAGMPFSILSVPLCVFLLKNILNLNTSILDRLLPCSVPKLQDPRALSLMKDAASAGIFKLLYHNLRTLGVQYDGLPFNAIKGFGAVY